MFIMVWHPIALPAPRCVVFYNGDDEERIRRKICGAIDVVTYKIFLKEGVKRYTYANKIFYSDVLCFLSMSMWLFLYGDDYRNR